MLKILRANTKALIWLFITLFVLWCIGSAISVRGQSKSYAKVGGKNVSQQLFQEFEKIVLFSSRYAELLGSQVALPPEFLTDTTLQYIALYRHARKRGIKISDEELKREIIQRFSRNNVFQDYAYQEWLQRVYQGPPRNFEEGVRKELAINKLMTLIREEVEISDEQIEKAFLLQNEEISLKYLVFPGAVAPDEPAPTQEQLVSFYEANPGLFKVPAKYDLTYLFFDWKEELENVTVTDEDVAHYYERITELEASKGSVPPLKAIEPSIRKELQIRQARTLASSRAALAQNIIQESRNFAKGAEYANKPALRTGLVPFEQLNLHFGRPSKFEEKLESMSPSALRLIEGQNGSYVILQTNKEFSYTAAFSDIEERVRSEYLNDQAMRKAKEMASIALDEIKSKGETLQAYAERTGRSLESLRLSLSRMQTSTLGPTRELLLAMMELKPGNLLPLPWKIENAFALVEVLERELPANAKENSARERFADQFVRQLQDSYLQQKLSMIIKEADINEQDPSKQDPFADIQEPSESK